MSFFNKVPILMYHSIIDNDDQSVSVKSFMRQMHLMKTMGYQTKMQAFVNARTINVKEDCIVCQLSRHLNRRSARPASEMY